MKIQFISKLKLKHVFIKYNNKIIIVIMGQISSSGINLFGLTINENGVKMPGLIINENGIKAHGLIMNENSIEINSAFIEDINNTDIPAILKSKINVCNTTKINSNSSTVKIDTNKIGVSSMLTTCGNKPVKINIKNGTIYVNDEKTDISYGKKLNYNTKYSNENEPKCYLNEFNISIMLNNKS
jgi:hypothetical protein